MSIASKLRHNSEVPLFLFCAGSEGGHPRGHGAIGEGRRPQVL